MKFFKKELLSNRLAIPSGHTVKFEQLGQSDTGVLATEDPGLIAELEKAASAGRGGVVSIDEPTYQELKKNPPAGRSRMRSLNAQSVRQLLSQQNRAGAPAAAAVNQPPSAPLEVPKGIVTVSSRRKLRELAESGGGDKTESRPSSPPSPSPTPPPPKPVTA